MNYRQRRFICEHPVKLTVAGKPIQAVIRNVHADGAKLSGVEGAGAGETCTLSLDGVPVRAVVRWTSGNSVGIAFKQKLMPRQGRAHQPHLANAPRCAAATRLGLFRGPVRLSPRLFRARSR